MTHQIKIINIIVLLFIVLFSGITIYNFVYPSSEAFTSGIDKKVTEGNNHESNVNTETSGDNADEQDDSNKQPASDTNAPDDNGSCSSMVMTAFTNSANSLAMSNSISKDLTSINSYLDKVKTQLSDLTTKVDTNTTGINDIASHVSDYANGLVGKPTSTSSKT